MRRRARRRATRLVATACAIGGLTATACTLVTSFDGLTGGSPSSDASAQDGAPSDAPSNDVTSADGAATDGDAGPFCATHPSVAGSAFCVDFDEGNAYRSQFASFNGNPLGDASLDPTTWTSPPASLLVAFAGTAGGGGYSFVAPVTTTAPRGLHFEVAVRMNAADVPVIVLLVSFGAKIDGQGLYNVYLELAKGQGKVVELSALDGGRGTYTGHDLLESPRVGAWSRVTVDVDFDTRSLKAVVDGQTALLGTSLVPDAVSGAASVTLGIEYTASTAPVSVNLDDVYVSGR